MYCPQCGYNNPPAASVCISCGVDFKNPPSTPQSENPALPVYAGFWTRFLANILDVLLLGSGMILLALAIAGLIAYTGRDGIVHSTLAASLLYGSFIFISAAYYTLMEAGIQNGTFGKRWMNIKVLDKLGNRLSISRSVWRLFAHLFSWLPLYLGFLIQPFTPRKQALHDLLAGTVVVQSSDSKKIPIMATMLVLFFTLMVPVLALVATAGLPLFHEYVQKVQLRKGLKIGLQATQAVSQFYYRNGGVPAAIGATGAYISSSPLVADIGINQQNGELSVTFSDAVHQAIRNKHLLFTPAALADKSISWRCHSNDIEAHVLPDSCQ